MMQQKKQYKRQTREVPEIVRQRISNSLKGRAKSFSHVQNISAGLKRYWSQIEKKDDKTQ